MARNFKVTVNGTVYDVNVEEVGASAPLSTNETKTVAAAETVTPAPTAEEAATTAPKVEETAPSVGGDESGAVTAPMPGKIMKIMVDLGEVVEAGQVLLLLEAMKMENEIFASTTGVVKQINCKEGETVNTGDTLLVIV